jgi:hypothetical protein
MECQDIVMQAVTDKLRHSLAMMSLISLLENAKVLLHSMIVLTDLDGLLRLNGYEVAIIHRQPFVIGTVLRVFDDM